MRALIPTAALIVAAASQAAIAASPMVDGEVKKVDKAAARVTLKHGEIKALEIPPMTMAYRVKDPALLEGLKPGDHVRFSVERVASQYTVVAIEPAR
jgi:Cu/Ag efflux protein CusF